MGRLWRLLPGPAFSLEALTRNERKTADGRASVVDVIAAVKGC